MGLIAGLSACQIKVDFWMETWSLGCQMYVVGFNMWKNIVVWDLLYEKIMFRIWAAWNWFLDLVHASSKWTNEWKARGWDVKCMCLDSICEKTLLCEIYYMKTVCRIRFAWNWFLGLVHARSKWTNEWKARVWDVKCMCLDSICEKTLLCKIYWMKKTCVGSDSHGIDSWT